MKWVKSFEAQGQLCAKSGNRFIIKAPYLSGKCIVCVPFKTFCHSKACRNKRANPKANIPINAPAYELSGKCCHVHVLRDSKRKVKV